MPGWVTPELIIAIAVVFGGGLVRGFSGFGSAMILSASLSALYGPAIAIPVTMAAEVVVGLQLLPAATRSGNLRTVSFIVIPAILFVPLGAELLTSLDGQITRYLISGLILAFIALLATGFKNPGEPRPLGSAVAGIFSGLGTGAFGIGGPPVILYFLTGPQAATSIRANLIYYFLILDAVAILVFLFKGLFGEQVMIITAAILPGYILGVFIGARFFHGASDQLYRGVAMVIVALIAVGSLLV